LYQLPLGVIGIALGVVLLPEFTRHLNTEDGPAVQASYNAALGYAMALTLPSAVALAVMPEAIVSVLFGHGAFTAADAAATAKAVAAFAVGLPAFVLIKIFSPAFFARQDTRTPMIFAGVSMVVNVALAYLLFSSYQHVGIAAATSVAGWVNAALLWATLRRQSAFVITPASYRMLGLLLASALMMGGMLYLLLQVSRHWIESTELLTQIGGLAFLVLAGAGIYGLLCQISGAVTMRDLLRGRAGRT
jgi:putative peptidoglycan lipid II flippase